MAGAGSGRTFRTLLKGRAASLTLPYRKRSFIVACLLSPYCRAHKRNGLCTHVASISCLALLGRMVLPGVENSPRSAFPASVCSSATYIAPYFSRHSKLDLPPFQNPHTEDSTSVRWGTRLALRLGAVLQQVLIPAQAWSGIHGSLPSNSAFTAKHSRPSCVCRPPNSTASGHVTAVFDLSGWCPRTSASEAFGDLGLSEAIL